MNEVIRKYTNNFFNLLISKFGFEIKTEMISDESYLMEYVSEKYVIKIEKYHREFYLSVYSLFDQDNEINFFNLLEFLKQNDTEVTDSKYFRKEKDVEECYKKQLNHISNVIYDNLDLLNDFFSKDKYEKNALEIHSYWKNKHPELYRTL